MCKACFDFADVDTQDTLKEEWNCVSRGCWESRATNDRYCKAHQTWRHVPPPAEGTTSAAGTKKVIGLVEGETRKRVFLGVDSVKNRKLDAVLRSKDENVPRCVRT